MATKVTEQDLQEMIWRADTQEKISIATKWIKRNVVNEDTKRWLLHLAEVRSTMGNDKHPFNLLCTCRRKSKIFGVPIMY